VSGRRYRNRIDITIEIPEIEGEPLAGKTITMDDLANQLLAVRTSKTKKQPAGSWDMTFTAEPVRRAAGVTLTGKRTWDQLIPDYSLVTIKMWRPGAEAEQAVMLGIKESGSQNEDYSQPRINRTRGITGSDLGKLLMEFKLYWLLAGFGIESEAFLGVKEAVAGYILDPELLTQDQPGSKIITALLDRYVTALNLRIVGRDMFQLIRYSAEGFIDFDENAVYPVPVTFQQDGSLWTVMQAYQDQSFQEMFIDTDPSGDFCEVVFRPYPFESDPANVTITEGGEIIIGSQNSLFDELARDPNVRRSRNRVATIVCPPEDLISIQQSRGVGEMKNLFWVMPRHSFLNDEEFKAVVPPSIINDPASVSNLDRFGLRPMEVRTPYVPVAIDSLESREESQTIRDQLIPLYVGWQNILRAWHGNNPRLWSGSIRAKGRGSYRIGDRLELPREVLNEYYIEQVDQAFAIRSGLFVSSLRVSRGFETGSSVDEFREDLRPRTQEAEFSILDLDEGIEDILEIL
jgi:hypothetical protein